MRLFFLPHHLRALHRRSLLLQMSM